MPLIAFIMVIIEHLIPFYSENSKEFLFYRIPHKKTVAIAHKLDELKYEMSGFIECSYKGRVHTHTINFDLKSCTCRWFWSFAVCAHLVAACDLYNRDLKGYTKPKRFYFKSITFNIRLNNLFILYVGLFIDPRGDVRQRL